MKKQSESAAPLSSAVAIVKPASYQELGTYLEHLRLTCLVDGRRLSISRLSARAGMSNTTYGKVKRALPKM